MDNFYSTALFDRRLWGKDPVLFDRLWAEIWKEGRANAQVGVTLGEMKREETSHAKRPLVIYNLPQ
jgi:hypothetical protein